MMDNKGPSRASAKQTLLTKRIDLSYGLLKRDGDQKNSVQDSTENDTKLGWNEARAKPRRTSAPAELPPIKDALPKLSMKPRVRTLSLRGENREALMEQWGTSKLQLNASLHQNKIRESLSTGGTSVRATHITEKDPQQRLLSGLTNNSNSTSWRGFVTKKENINLNYSGQIIGRKCLTQEALICHELGYADSEENPSIQKKDMIVRWLNSEAPNSCPRRFPQL